MTISRDNAKDAGLALILILLIAGIHEHNFLLITIAACLVLLNMILPQAFTPFAHLWFGLSHLLGPVMSKVILTLIYLLVVVPIGRLRKITGADPMGLKTWRINQESVFIDRDHTFTREDMENPY